MQISTNCDYIAAYPIVDIGEDYMLLECLPNPQFLHIDPDQPICIKIHEGTVESADVNNSTLVCKTPHFLRAYFGGMPMFEIKSPSNSTIALYKGDYNDFVAVLPKGAIYTTHWGR